MKVIVFKTVFLCRLQTMKQKLLITLMTYLAYSMVM